MTLPTREEIAEILDRVPRVCAGRHYGDGPFTHAGCLMIPDVVGQADALLARLRPAWDEHARQAVEESWWPVCGPAMTPKTGHRRKNPKTGLYYPNLVPMARGKVLYEKDHEAVGRSVHRVIGEPVCSGVYV